MENLQVGGFQLRKKELKGRIEEVVEMLPVLKERARQEAGRLSGGEQQMLAFARALVPKPKLLMLDEPSLGLSPKLVGAVFEKVTQVSQETGVTVLIVEQKVRDVLRIAHRAYGMRLGKIALEGPPDEILAGDNLKRLFCHGSPQNRPRRVGLEPAMPGGTFPMPIICRNLPSPKPLRGLVVANGGQFGGRKMAGSKVTLSGRI